MMVSAEKWSGSVRKMAARCCLRIAVIAVLSGLASVDAADDYRHGPDSRRQDGVPQGTVTRSIWTSSRVYPGTVRDMWVYVPAQYAAAKPACVMIFQDGGGYVRENGSFRATIVMDNLIHQGQMPVTIGIFLNPGTIPAVRPGANPRRNRSFEYDTLSDQYARFLTEEILPEVGQKYRLTDDPERRAGCGISSGGIAAFVLILSLSAASAPCAAWKPPSVDIILLVIAMALGILPVSMVFNTSQPWRRHLQQSSLCAS